MAWYASKLAIARVTVPYEGQPAQAGAIVDRRKPRNFIDEQIDKQLARLNLPPSPACGDAEFVRRAYVDTIGRLPTIDEARAFFADASPSRRDALIDSLLDPARVQRLLDLQMVRPADAQRHAAAPAALKTYYQWIKKQVADGVPWDQFVRAIITATGESVENGPTNFYALSQSPEDMTENVCQAFLGLSIGCAKCHNHPLEKWTNDQYYGMASLFARVKAKGWGGEGRDGDGRRTLYVAESGELVQPQDRQAAAADAARRPAARLRRSRRSPREPGEVADRARRTPTSPDRSPTASGPTISASAWSRKSTICGSRTRRATTRCWRPRPITSCSTSST